MKALMFARHLRMIADRMEQAHYANLDIIDLEDAGSVALYDKAKLKGFLDLATGELQKKP